MTGTPFILSACGIAAAFARQSRAQSFDAVEVAQEALEFAKAARQVLRALDRQRPAPEQHMTTLHRMALRYGGRLEICDHPRTVVLHVPQGTLKGYVFIPS